MSSKLAALGSAVMLALAAICTAHAQENVQDLKKATSLASFAALQTDFNLPLTSEGQATLRKLGAMISLKIDRIADTNSVSADGTAFLGGIYSGRNDLHVAFGGYLQSDGTNQFATGTKDSKSSDVFTPGGFVQLDTPILGRTQSFRLRSGVSFATGGTRVATTVFEWQPHIAGNIGQFRIPSTPLEVAWTPELLVQYDRLVGGSATYEIFSQQKDALRLGPQIAFTFWCNATVCDENSVGDRLTLTLTGHTSASVLRERLYGFGQAALSYRLSSMFGLGVSYGYGSSDATGNLQSQIKIGLTVKYSPPSPAL